MNKSVKKIAGFALSALMLFSVVGCGGGNPTDSDSGSGNLPEKPIEAPLTGAAYSRPVVFSTDVLDGTFSPFYASSGPDTQIVSLTQISMLTSENGKLVCGEDQPTVAKEFTKTVAPDNSYTDYKFVIKQGIKFSNGVELTMRDVLFNLYVYLDPAYMGSSTMYSTDIKGLKSYRQQDPKADDSAMNDAMFNRKFEDAADNRIRDVLDYLDKKEDEGFTADELAQIQKDIERVKELFSEEVRRDWTNNAGQQESYKEEYGFTENWEIFYYAEGIVNIFVPANTSKPLKDVNGRYITNITPTGVELAADTAIVQGVEEREDGKKYYDGTYYDQTIINGIENARNAKLAELFPEANGEYTEEQKATYAVEEAVKEYAIDQVYTAYTMESKLWEVVGYWQSGSDLRSEIVTQERSAYFNSKADGVESIYGITTNNDADLAKATELYIRINGVDPKAEYNFSFIVAPMHYYSTPEAIETTKYGVKVGDAKFFGEDGLRAPHRIGVPVGAGPYMATNSASNDDVTKSNFYESNVVYFKRNEYFTTVGQQLTNAKIRLLRYQVVNSDQIINSVQKGTVDIGSPNATVENIAEIQNVGMDSIEAQTNGYGYVGINAKMVPDIEVRRAIMYAIDIYDSTDYYKQYAQPVYRSMSRESWAYPKNATLFYDLGVASEGFESDKDFIQDLVAKAGWYPNAEGKLVKDNKKLELTFTIAGGSTDHPAFTMFNKAKVKLENCGFTITVKNDVNALRKLTTGQLEVWAAAWSSTIDPDMYQVYHKDSKATSVLNWGYKEILNDQTGQYEEENGILYELSTLIDQARKTDVTATRTTLYAQALDKLMELAVELPTYQRQDCTMFNPNVIDIKSLNQNANAFSSAVDKIWELRYVEGLKA